MRGALGGAREVNETRVEFARDERNAYTAVVTAMRDNSGRIVGGTVSLRSLTEQRAAEERLAEAERHARTVIELSGDLHSRTDGRGPFVICLAHRATVAGLRAL